VESKPVTGKIIVHALAYIILLCLVPHRQSLADESLVGAKSKEDRDAMFAAEVRPLIVKYCLDCHSTKEMKGELDLQRFTSSTLVRKDVKPWQAMIQQLETGEMPPKDKPQPTASQRKLLLDWTRQFLDDEARARAGDPGRVPLRRLSNTEYNNTIRDLTGVDLQPTRDFPADGAAGEGFTNAAEALSMSPALMAKYVNAAKKIASHAVLLPDGFRFSPTRTRRDWTDESLAELRKFYWQFTRDGRLPLQPYMSALVRHRADLQAGKVKLTEIADSEKLSSKYLETLWQAMNGKDNSYPLDRVRQHWQRAEPSDVEAIVAEVTALRDPLWNSVPIGSYRYGNTVRAVAKQPTVNATQTIKVSVQPAPGQSEVVLYFVANELSATAGEGHIVLRSPRFVGDKLPTLLLRDYEQFGPTFELDYAKLFARTEAYLSAAAEAAHDSKLASKVLAAKYQLDETWLQRWIAVADVKPLTTTTKPVEELGRVVPAMTFQLLDGKTPANPQRPAINGWKPKGADLPILISNSSDKAENVPGRVSPHSITVHPTPTEFVAVVWKSPFAGRVSVSLKVSDAHANCGNGVAWWLENKSSTRAAIVAEGAVDIGKESNVIRRELAVSIGDLITLAIDPRDANHSCDLTEISLKLTEIGNKKTNNEKTNTEKERVWDLATDVANNVLAGNPHADSLGNKDTWSFVQGPSKSRPLKSGPAVETNSLLTRWRKAASDPAQRKVATELAKQLQTLLTTARPADPKQSDGVLYDSLASYSGPLLQGIDISQLAKADPKVKFGLATEQFGKHPLGRPVDENNLVQTIDKVIEVRLPAELFRNREFVVEANLDADSTTRVVQLQVLTTPPKLGIPFDAKTPVVAVPGGAGQEQFLAGLAEFRRLFPPNICYPHVIPLDEVVCLKTFHREDEPLVRLFLNEQQTQQIDRLWNEHKFISHYPVVENEYLPLFIGFVTQDQSKQLLDYFEGQRPVFRKRAEDFKRDFDGAAPQQLEQLIDFASRVYRRPLLAAEASGLRTLYQSQRENDISHEDAFHSVLARVFMSPSFLLHLEQPPNGKLARPVNDWELASRLSYFIWASLPDDELRQLAAAGRLHEPEILAEQTQRMLKDDRVRALAIEFGTQWIHVRGFSGMKEKNENLFPTFDANLRQAIYEESILFFQDLFQNHRPVTHILDADYTFLNEALAKHYNIPGVSGEQWRRVDGVKKHGRGGILGLASVQAKQAGASRTSPVLRGNWVVETLLGEKLPRPPLNVPQLPEQETGNDGLTMRQVVEKHVSASECAICHQRIDPFGFALEKYDPIGRLRDRDLSGLPLDSQAKLRDGSEFEGIEGLRNYLLTQKKDTIARLFCRRLLGYAVGRSVTLSDQLLLDKLTAETEKNGGVSNAVMAIVQSKQFQMIRGSEYSDDE
jgi:hypothetical protein